MSATMMLQNYADILEVDWYFSLLLLCACSIQNHALLLQFFYSYTRKLVYLVRIIGYCEK